MRALKHANAYTDKQHLEADNEAQILRDNASARLAVAKDKTRALIKEAGAESNQQNNMVGQRKHNEKMKLNDALEVLARQGHMVVSGKNGDAVLDFYNNAITEIIK